MSTAPSNLPPGTAPEELDRAAFDCTAPLRAAMPVEEAPRFTLDAYFAAGKGLQTAQNVAALRADMTTLPKFDIANLDNLADLSRALRFVQTELFRRVRRAKEIPGLLEEGYALRRLLLHYAEGLSFKGAVAPELIVQIRAGAGNLDLVEDLTVLVRELLAQPAELFGPHASVTSADLRRASEVANEINVRIGEVAQIDLDQAALMDERRKLGGLLLRGHAQVRRAVAYLRFDEGDVDTLVPSLYVPGGPKKRAPGESAAESLAELHEGLHAHDAAAPEAPLAPEDNPFAPDPE